MQKVFEIIDRQQAKIALKKAFFNASLFISYKNGDKTYRIFPKIHSVKIDKDQTEYVFTLRNGMDPKEVTKKEYVFMQHFGANIELDGDHKTFTLTVYRKTFPKELKYNYDAILPVIDGLNLPIVAGMDRHGQWHVYDAINEPGLLISGEPGAGKSSQVRSIISTLIQYKKPHELEIYLGDLKMSEFHLFYDIEHVKNVCIYPEDLWKMLTYLTDEMKRRGELLNKYRVTHVNKLPESEKVPYILICIDEFVMIMDDKDMKAMLIQLVALGRALGMVCVLSLQRPSHDILDTKIRSCLTVRMGFRVSDFSNAKIIGTPGAEKIAKETPGRFLLKRSDIVELQAPYLDEKQAEKILAAYKSADWKNHFTGDFKAPSPQYDEDMSEDNILGVLDDGTNQT
ncbi:FtsK/SpoIIIE domain-containing protein [Aeribacillus pallidus]|uniref:FtsK/SpoIIIE domain-containing protein n=1 Tax=Aeribacillus pallidus TaxID=33936 RepID=UPI003D252193